MKRIIYNIFYYSGLWLLIWFFNRRRVAILMYHGVTEKDCNIWTQITRFQFEEQLDYIRRRCQPVSMSKAVSILISGSGKFSRPVAVTFDDGFKNNCTVAHPILTKYSIPATIYLTTSFIEKDPKFRGLLWTDYLYLMLRAARGRTIDLRDMTLNEYRLDSFEACADARNEIAGYLKSIPASKKNMILQNIAERLDFTIKSEDYNVFESLGWDEIIQMSKSELVDFGAHTVRHEILTRISTEEAGQEMRESKEIIESKISAVVESFAYPNGREEDFNDEIQKIASENFLSAVSTIEGLNRQGCNLFMLRRINIGNDMDMLEFKMRLSGAYHFLQFLSSKLTGKRTQVVKGY